MSSLTEKEEKLIANMEKTNKVIYLVIFIFIYLFCAGLCIYISVSYKGSNPNFSRDHLWLAGVWIAMGIVTLPPLWLRKKLLGIIKKLRS